MVKFAKMISEGYRKRIMELGGVISENSLYGGSVVNSVCKRIGDSSEDTLNKIAVFGLFRAQQPFASVGDISTINNKEELDGLYKKWFEKTIAELIKTTQFVDNEELASKYVNAYVENIKSLKNAARPFSAKDVEKSLIDLVNNNNWLGGDSEKSSFWGIYNPDEEDVLYMSDDIVIVKGDTKAKCVMYGAGKPWCITKPELNYYNTYRIHHGATIFFCMQPKVKGHEHTFVIMNYGEDEYAIADETNSGERAGGPENAMSWREIEREIPNLKGLEEYFEYQPVTKDEKRYSEIIKRRVDTFDLGGYIRRVTRNLRVNGAQISTKDFIRDYVAYGNRIRNKEEFGSLDDEMVSSLIESGYVIPGEYFELVNDKLKRRYLTIATVNGYNIDRKLFSYMTDDMKEKYIDSKAEKYVKNGTNFDYVLFLNLPANLQSRYLQGLADNGHGIPELGFFAKATDEQKKQFLKNEANKEATKSWKDFRVSDEVFNELPENLKKESLWLSSRFGNSLTAEQFKVAPLSIKKKMIDKDTGTSFSQTYWDSMTDELKSYFFEKNKNNLSGMAVNIFNQAPESIKKHFLEENPDKTIALDQFLTLSEPLKLIYVRNAFDKYNGEILKIPTEVFRYTSDEEKEKFLNKKIIYVPDEKFIFLPDRMKKRVVDFLMDLDNYKYDPKRFEQNYRPDFHPNMWDFINKHYKNKEEEEQKLKESIRRMLRNMI